MVTHIATIAFDFGAMSDEGVQFMALGDAARFFDQKFPSKG